MSFEVSEQHVDGFDLVVLEDKSSRTRVSILPAYGALLHAVMLETPQGALNLIDNYPDAASLEADLKLSYKGCKLSPFVCRINNGEYDYDGKRLSFLDRHYDHSAIHGLLYNKAFSISTIAADNGQAYVQCSYAYRKEDPGYPFEYRCEVRYTLLPENLLRVDTTVINNDAVTIPIADGWHPYFRLGGLVNDWLLQFRAASMVELNDNLVPTGNLSGYDDFRHAKPVNTAQLDNCFLLDSSDDIPACSLVNPQRNVSVLFFPDHSYPYLQLYIPPKRESIAIENLSAPPDSFNNKMGLTLLPAGNSKLYRLHYQFFTD